MLEIKVKIFLIIFFLFLNSAHADQKDIRLNQLFDELFLSSSNIKTNIILADIWNIWYIAKDEETQMIFDKGNQFMDSGDFDSAIKLFSETIELSPDFAEAWNKRATVYFLQGELEKSIAVKGGTTEAGIKNLKNYKIDKIIYQTYMSAYRRAKKLGKKN